MLFLIIVIGQNDNMNEQKYLKKLHLKYQYDKLEIKKYPIHFCPACKSI